MFQRVLVPLDGSQLADEILVPLTSQLGVDTNSEVVLLRVTSAEEEGLAQGHLLGLHDRWEREGQQFQTCVRQGDPAEQILAAIEELKPDLVAMSTHGRSGVDRWIRGSVAERVLRHCPVPLLLANPSAFAPEGKTPSWKRILVPLDGSPRTDAILPLVQELARRCRAKLVLAHVLPYPDPLPSGYGPVPLWDLDKARKQFAPQEERLQAAGIETELIMLEGYPAERILELSEEADLVALASHGRTGASRWWFGSVAENVLRSCTRPVFVYRPPAT